MNRPEIGTEVWYRYIDDTTDSGIVIECSADGQIVKVKPLYCPNELWIEISECYASEDELLYAMKRLSEDGIKEILNEIKTVEDLVRYMYNHTVSRADEYTECDARRAVAIKAKELLGVQLE